MKIKSREILLSALAEAAELEHTLMCQYLYAVFSLKRRGDKSLSNEESELVEKWRKQLLDICIQEMGHLALVCNLTTAVGGMINLSRADFPVRLGIFPENFALDLKPFSLEALDHFIFLESSDSVQTETPQDFSAEKSYSRNTPYIKLSSHVGDYQTVGQLYEAILSGLEYLHLNIGKKLFCGSKSLQLGPAQVRLDGLKVIESIKDASEAIGLIVDQGEGSKKLKESHFEKFSALKNELQETLVKNPKFAPAKNVVTNPVMLKPVDPKNKTWIQNPAAAQVLDFANSLYTFMLRLLLQTYSMEHRSESDKKRIAECAFILMHCLSEASAVLTELPAAAEGTLARAGMSFDINRHFRPYELSSEKIVLNERLKELIDGATKLERTLEITKIIGSLEHVGRILNRAVS